MNLKESIKSFFSDKYNLVFIAVLIFAFAIRLYFFFITKNQAVWWDEGEYLSTAKHWILGVPYDVHVQRQPLFPLVLAFLMKFGVTSESVLKFLTVLLPSVFSIFLMYLFGKEIYDKKTALIGTFLLSVFWTHLFWTNRFSTDIFGFVFTLLAFYSLWKFYNTKSGKWLMFMGFSLGLGFLTRVGGMLPVFIIVLFALLAERLNLFKNKFWLMSGCVAFLTILPYLIWDKLKYGNFLAFFPGYFDAAHTTEKLAKPIAWWIFSFFQIYNEWIFFIVFLIGLICFLNLFLGFDLIFKNKDSPLKKELFLLISILVPLIFFVFIERNVEDRWMFAMIPAMFIIIAKGFGYIQAFISKYNKILASIVVIALLAFGAYMELTHADAIIKYKLDSYGPVRDSGIWIKENSLPSDIILSNSLPQSTYYTERRVLGVPPGNQFENITNMFKPKFLVLSLFDKSPDESYDYPVKYNETLMPVRAYYFDKEQTQPSLIVYAFRYQ